MFRLLLAFALTLITLSLPAGEKSPPSQREIKALVEQLVSPNKAPVQDLDSVLMPPEYDEAAQKRIYAAIAKLLRIGPPAFPYLVERFNDGRFDNRYCVSDDDGPADINFDVGTVCRRIVSRQLQPYQHFTIGEDDPRTRPRRPDYITVHKLSDPKAFEMWWKTRKDKTLRDLQIEVLEWTIAEEERRPGRYSGQERNHLKKDLAELRRSQGPLRPGWPFAK